MCTEIFVPQWRIWLKGLLCDMSHERLTWIISGVKRHDGKLEQSVLPNVDIRTELDLFQWEENHQKSVKILFFRVFFYYSFSQISRDHWIVVCIFHLMAGTKLCREEERKRSHILAFNSTFRYWYLPSSCIRIQDNHVLGSNRVEFLERHATGS